MLLSVIQLYKKAYSGLSRYSWYLSAVMLINRAGTMVVAFMSVYCIHELHFTIGQAGIIMMLFGVGSIAGGFIGGKLTDRFGFYDLQVAALISGGLLFIVLGLQHTFITLAIGAMVLSLFNESVRPANSSAIAHYSAPDKKTRSISLNRLAVNLGWATGSALGGFLASINYHLLFWVDGGSNIMAAILLLILMPKSKIAKTIKKRDRNIVKVSPYKDTVYLLFVGFGMLFFICFYEFMIIEPAFYKLDWHFNETFIGFLMAFNGILISVIEMVMIHNLEGRKHGLHYIIIGVLLGAASFFLLNFMPPTAFMAIITVIFITFSEMLSMPFMSSFMMERTTSDNLGEYAGIYSMSWSFAQIAAPLIGGFVISFGGFAALWWVLGGLSLVSATGYYFLYRKNYIKKQTLPVLP
jgi:predicted MFS family arabinose efflux permease